MGKVKEYFLHDNGRTIKVKSTYIHGIPDEYLDKEVHFNDEPTTEKTPVDRIFDEMYGKTNHAVLQAMTLIAHKLGCTEAQAIKFISPRLLVPTVCKVLNLDEIEYGNEIYKSLKWVVEWAEVTGFFANTYRCTNTCEIRQAYEGV